MDAYDNARLRRIGMPSGQALDIQVSVWGEQYCGNECFYLTRAYRSGGIGWDCKALKTELELAQVAGAEENPFDDEPMMAVKRCEACKARELPERVPETLESHDDLHQAFRRLDQVWDARPGHKDWEERLALIAKVGKYEDENVPDPPLPDPRDAALFRLDQSELEECHIKQMEDIIAAWRKAHA